MSIIQAVIISVIEGITEFLPISSTGHMILASDLMNISQSDFVKSFEIIIQLGAILAVVFIYRKKIYAGIPFWTKILAAFIPTAFIGFAFYKVVKNYFIGNTAVVLISLLLGGIALILLEKIFANKVGEGLTINDLSVKNSFLIGIIQSLSVIPGVSRSAATIFGGLIAGLGRKEAVEFSFLLAIPTMFAATGLDLLKSGHSFTRSQTFVLTVGFLGAFITAVGAIRFLLNFVKNHSFIPFGIYRILLAVFGWFVLFR